MKVQRDRQHEKRQEKVRDRDAPARPRLPRRQGALPAETDRKSVV